jgi:hypothetical protein
MIRIVFKDKIGRQNAANVFGALAHHMRQLGDMDAAEQIENIRLSVGVTHETDTGIFRAHDYKQVRSLCPKPVIFGGAIFSCDLEPNHDGDCHTVIGVIPNGPLEHVDVGVRIDGKTSDRP